MKLQREMPLDLSADVALVPLDTVGAHAGVHAEEVIRKVDQGEWPWVFDIGSGRKLREMRVWRLCLTEPQIARDAEIDGVIANIIGTETGDVRGAQIETRWRVSDRTIKRLCRAGEIACRINGHTLWLQRASLAAFLQRRRVI